MSDTVVGKIEQLTTCPAVGASEMSGYNVGPDDGCICRGNWRNIVSECESLFQKKFADRDGQEWTLFGVVWGEDDFYYGMWRDGGKVLLLSCVGSIEGHGFSPVNTEVT